MYYGRGVRNAGDLCRNAADFAHTYSMSYDEWLAQHYIRLHNEYYEECANFCRRPVEKV